MSEQIKYNSRLYVRLIAKTDRYLGLPDWTFKTIKLFYSECPGNTAGRIAEIY